MSNTDGMFHYDYHVHSIAIMILSVWVIGTLFDPVTH